MLVEGREPPDGVVEPVVGQSHDLRHAGHGGRQRPFVVARTQDGVDVLGAPSPGELQHEGAAAVDREFHEQPAACEIGP